MRKLFFCLTLFNLLLIGCSSDSDSNQEIVPDVTAPELNITLTGFPHNSGEPIVASNSIEINIDAKDEGGIAKIEAFLNNEKVGEDTTAPYQIVVDISTLDSKNASTKKYKDYTLRVTATDKSGNTQSKEQIINVDNEKPIITSVSLESGTIINGNENTVSFEVMDNEELSSVKAYLNEELLIEVADEIYEININTLELQDGQNILKIEAIDIAENSSTFEINFISDNTGPEITIENLTENQILDNPFKLNPIISDVHSDIALIEVLFGENQLLLAQDMVDFQLEFIPEEYPIGKENFTFIAFDELGNQTSLSIPTEVKRKLFTIRLENGFLQNDWVGFWVLISEMDGTAILNKSIESNISELIIHANDEFPLEKEYMVSFIADENNGSFVKTHMTIVQNLTRLNFDEINFSPGFGEKITYTTVPMTGFEGVENVVGRGNGFQTTHDNNLENLTLDINSGYGYAPYNGLYLTGYNLGESPSYGYYRINYPFETNLEIKKSDFLYDNVATGTVNFSENSLTNYDDNLFIWGFESPSDLQNGNSHLVYDSFYTFQSFRTRDYFYPDLFSSYKHHFRLNNYNTFRNGLPNENYLIPNWEVSYTQNEKVVTINKSGTGYTVGRLIIDLGFQDNSQLVTLIYDSSKQNQVYIPEIPEELNNLNAFESFKNSSISVDYAELVSFDDISKYQEYLLKVISVYKEHDEVSPVMESVLDKNGYIFANWSFKYW